MSGKSSRALKVPLIVQRITEAVTNRLGRPAYSRKVKNSDEWFISDPVFARSKATRARERAFYELGYAVGRGGLKVGVGCGMELP